MDFGALVEFISVFQCEFGLFDLLSCHSVLEFQKEKCELGSVDAASLEVGLDLFN